MRARFPARTELRWGNMGDATIDVLPMAHSVSPPVRAKVQVVPLRGLPIVAVAVVFVALSIGFNWRWGLMVQSRGRRRTLDGH